MEKHDNLYRIRLRIFNRLYKLHQRIEAGGHSLKTLVGDLIRNKTNHKNGNGNLGKIICYNLIWTIREATNFESKTYFWKNL
ncbi:MAG: hypothetical protein QW222_06565 [Candidatus Bathyarchaeia archaeon]